MAIKFDNIEAINLQNHAGTNVLTLNSSSTSALFSGDVTIDGGDIVLGGTGRIQGIDTVSANTDAANKQYVDNHTYSHTHSASDITSGTFAAARIAHNSFDIGDTTAETGRSVHETGIYTFNRNNGTLGTGTDAAYYSVLAWGQGSGGSAQIAAKWTDGGDKLYYRSLRDTTDNWWNWREIYHTGNNSGILNSNVTLSSLGAAAAGDENIIDGALSIWNADGDGDVFTYSDANPTHNGDTVGAVINIKGDGAEFGSLVRAGQYTADHVSVSRGYYVGAALNTTDSTTQKVIDSVGNLIVGPDTVDIRSGTISVGGDANTYYPVVWYYNTQSQAFLNKIQIYRNYNETAPNSWNTSTHKGGLLLDLQANWGGWGGVNYDIKVNEFSETYSNMVGKISHFANSRGFAIWLRGGTATYHFYTEGPQINPTVQLSAYDPGNNSTGVSSITSLDTANINNRLYFRSGILYSQNSQVLTVANEGSGNGIDADTVDGIQGASFLRSDANDTATGQITINTSGNALTVTSQQSIGAIITGGNNNSDIIQLKKGSNIEARLDTSGHWHVDGDVIAYSTSTSSDKKLKTNISTLTDALDKTIKLRGVNFDWIDENKPNNQVGFIAQEVEKVLPEVVKNVETLNKENETHKAVDYAAVVPLLVEAIKEQQKQIDELKSIINGSS